MTGIANKSEKIASAIYLITGFFNDQEPLKWDLRSLAGELVHLGASFSIESVLSEEREIVLSETRQLVLKLTKLFHVAKNAGLVSPNNHDIMQDELSQYGTILGKPVGLSSIFSLKDGEEKANIAKMLESPTASQGGGLEATVPETPDRDNQEGPAIVKDKNFRELLPAKDLKEFGVAKAKKNTRQSIIIGILKRKKEIMIKDVSPLIRACSEKTIQRELLSMVESGILKKTGEKRWSKYSLA